MDTSRISIDLPEADDETGALLSAEGYTRVPMPTRHLADVSGPSPAFLVGETQNKRRFIRRIQAAHEPLRFTRLDRAGVEAQLDTLYAQYLAVAHHTREINMFDLPARVFPAMADSPAWEVITITHCDAPGILGWYAAHRHGLDDTPLACGLDYTRLYEFNTYRHLMFEVMRAGRERGASLVHLGMSANREKRRFGTRPESTVAYVLRRDSYASARLGVHREQATLGRKRLPSKL